MLLRPPGRAHVDRAAGLVQVTDFTDRLDQVALYLEAVQLRASRQVRLDARVLEVTSGAAGQPIDWNDMATRSGAGVRRAAPGVAGLRVTDLGALMNAIASQGSVRTIASLAIAGDEQRARDPARGRRRDAHFVRGEGIAAAPARRSRA